MSSHLKKSVSIALVSISVLACQNQQGVDVVKTQNYNEKDSQSIVNAESSSKERTLIKYKPSPCKKSSSPLIKDKNKIKAMLYKEEKLNNKMSEDEINTYINNFIKSKSSVPCKPIQKKPSNLPSSEK